VWQAIPEFNFWVIKPKMEEQNLEHLDRYSFSVDERGRGCD
jgi:hypothetical protein